jgi:Flp pilus assembly protein TadG
MRIIRAWIDKRGTSTIEFAMTAPIFFMMVFGVFEGALMLWTQVGLQHGVQLAARCASVNTTMCGNVTAIQSYAAQNSFGLNPSPSVFTVSTPACGKQVNASFTYSFLTGYFAGPTLTLTAESCFPALS